MAERIGIEELEGRSPTFKPYSRYCRESDCLEFFIGGDDARAERVDAILTVYWSEHDEDALTGCEIKGVRRLVDEAGAVGIEIAKGGRLRLSALISAYQGLYPDRIPVRTYDKLMRFAREPMHVVELGTEVT